MRKIMTILLDSPFASLGVLVASAAMMILLVSSGKVQAGSVTRDIYVKAEYSASETEVPASTAALVTTLTTTSAAAVTTTDTTTSTETTETTSTETTETTTVAEMTTETISTETAATATSTETAEEETRETAAEAVVPPAIYDFISAGESPNSSFYQSRLTVIGDSIAYGFNCYGFIPFEHNLATESVSMWNWNGFTFDKGGGNMGIIDAADYVHPQLIYMSLGLNDVNNNDPGSFAASYSNAVSELRSRIPEAVIVVAGITPVSAECSFTSNETIRSYNSALQSMAESFGSERVLYFDAYSVIADPDTLAQSSTHAGGDGIHLGPSAYSLTLTALFNYLDYYGAAELIG